MSDFKKLNNLAGWGTFLISMVVYIMTLEETASFWDCGEFIAIAYKLEVSHPPGAPLFMLIGRLFSFLALGDVGRVAYWINMSSALASGFTILFMYWSIVMLGRKLIGATPGKETKTQQILLIGAGAAGTLSFAFSDSFWFSAVEGEVYAMSSFFTAIVFWAMLKWELVKDESTANKWLLFIAYMIGLSSGVHLLGLVTLPALGLIYYFKKYEKPNFRGVVITLAFSLILIGFVDSLVIKGLPSIAQKLEITFVNTFGLPFNSGVLFMSVVVILLLFLAIRITAKKELVEWNTLALAITFVLIGNACYGIIPIRSAANPPIDQNNPENAITFTSYLKREQYGSRPLLYGPYFNAPSPRFSQGAPVYYKAEDRYKIADYKSDLEYDPEWEGLFPRMWSTQPGHVKRYRELTGVKPDTKPTKVQDMVFFFGHQLGTMYMRYFMFNFVGRESDIQMADWIGPFQAGEKVPEVIRNNKGRNQYYAIPLILGLIGFFFQFNKDPKRFAATFMLFLLTGVALVVYLNSGPIEPRERDYIYVGSYYVFAFWIGFSVLAIGNRLLKKGGLHFASIAIGMLSPLLLISQNWDDHDRSDRYFSVDSARNFLASCAPNAILFTGGDNDTFPLWYVQEVEGFRTDVRVVVLSYYNTDWYIDQTKMKMNDSEAFKYSLTLDNYRQGTNDYLLIAPQPPYAGKSIDLPQYMSLLKDDFARIPQLKRQLQSGGELNTMPSRIFSLDVDTARVLQKGIIPERLKPFLQERLYFQMDKNTNVLEKGQMMLLDLIAQNNWERPIYFNYTSVSSLSFDLNDYLVHEGMAYRLLPVRKPPFMRQMVNLDVMYDNLHNKFQFRGMDKPDANLNEDYRGFAQNHRSTFTTLADALMEAGDTTRAKTTLDYAMHVLPHESLPWDISSVGFVSAYLEVGETEKALKTGMDIAREFDAMVGYHLRKQRIDRDFRKYSSGLQYLEMVFDQYGHQAQKDSVTRMISSHGLRTPGRKNSK